MLSKRKLLALVFIYLSCLQAASCKRKKNFNICKLFSFIQALNGFVAVFVFAFHFV